MPIKDKVIEELDFLTELLSARSRALAGGVLAVAWVFLLANATGREEANLISSSRLLVPVILALLSLLADLGQYWSGFWMARKHLDAMETSGLDSKPYDYKAIWFRCREAFFYAKLALMLVSVLWLLALLLVVVF